IAHNRLVDRAGAARDAAADSRGHLHRSREPGCACVGRAAMRKIFYVAKRDFIATINTKGFIIAVLVPPTLYAEIMIVFPRLIDNTPPRVHGEIAVIDPTGAVFDAVARHLTPESIGERRRGMATRRVAGMPPGASDMARPQLEAALAGGLELQPVKYTEAELAAQKERLKRRDAGDAHRLLAVVTIQRDAVTPRSGSTTYGAYELFVRPNLDDRVQSEIRTAVGEAIVDARMQIA